MDYSPWSSKNLIDWNWPKKFMQVGIDVKFMHNNFGGRDLFGFGDIATFQKWPNFPFRAWTIVHGHQKKLINRNQLKKFMHVGIDITCMYTNLGGCGLSSFGDTATLKNGQFSLSDHGLYGHQKI